MARSIHRDFGRKPARLRQECLGEDWFLSLTDARANPETRRCQYHDKRLHGSLGNLVPSEFVRLGQATMTEDQPRFLAMNGTEKV